MNQSAVVVFSGGQDSTSRLLGAMKKIDRQLSGVIVERIKLWETSDSYVEVCLG